MLWRACVRAQLPRRPRRDRGTLSTHIGYFKNSQGTLRTHMGVRACVPGRDDQRARAVRELLDVLAGSGSKRLNRVRAAVAACLAVWAAPVRLLRVSTVQRPARLQRFLVKLTGKIAIVPLFEASHTCVCVCASVRACGALRVCVCVCVCERCAFVSVRAVCWCGPLAALLSSPCPVCARRGRAAANDRHNPRATSASAASTRVL
jgi:hypothetical protein